MSSKRVWAVTALTPVRTVPRVAVPYGSLAEALRDVALIGEYGFSATMRSYVVPA